MQVKTLAMLFSLLSLGTCPGPVVERDQPASERVTATAAFTAKLTHYFASTHYYQWLLDTSHGQGNEWSAYWTGVDVHVRNGQVSFVHRLDDAPDNIMIPSSRVLGHATAAYLWTGNAAAGVLAEQYANGLSATMLGMQFHGNDQERGIMARAIMPRSHSVVMANGRAKFIDYDAWRRPSFAWNTDTIAVPNNPYWPDLWVKNIRSKDDVPHIFLAASILPLARTQAADKAYELLRGFTSDIVAHDFWIRSKNAQGELFYPGRWPFDDALSDLSSFVHYRIPFPKAECNARLATALIAGTWAEDCGDGVLRAFDLVATQLNFYNYQIYSTAHLASATLATAQRNAAAARLIDGLASRVAFDLNLRDEEIPKGNAEQWRGELASFIVYAAATGMPVGEREAAFVQERFGAAIDRMLDWQPYDVWTAADGEYPLRPEGVPGLDASVMGAFVWYCWSPYRLAGATPLVDCESLRTAF